MPPPRDLDAESQRRLILQAAKECAPDDVRSLCKTLPTLRELDKEIQEHLWVCLLFFWMPFVFIPVGISTFSLWRIRNTIHQRWGAMLANPDPECALWAVEGDIRRILKGLPRSQRRQAKQIVKELERVSKHWGTFQQKLLIARNTLASAREEMLRSSLLELGARVEMETDPMTRASLERQARAIEGQIEASRTLGAWVTRLEAAQGECMQSLLHLRTQLALVAAVSPGPALVPVNDAAAELQELNRRLAATQSAAEELVQLQV